MIAVKLTKVQARKLGALITHGHASFAGSAYITRWWLKSRGLIEYKNGVGYRVTALGVESYEVRMWNVTRRENREMAKEFDRRVRSVGIHRSDARETWAWFLKGYQIGRGHR